MPAARGTFLLDMSTQHGMSGTLAAAAVASLLFALMPAAAFAALAADGSEVPIVQGEAPARSCYVRAEHQWNRVMDSSPRDHQQLDSAYRAFAACAKMAVDTGKVLRSGERVPWMPEYFADTVGATYAQLQLAVITSNPEHCTHLSQAQDLAEQASETEGEMDTPGNADFENMWGSLQQNLKMQTAGCGKTISSRGR
jgi:hypothetical protein